MSLYVQANAGARLAPSAVPASDDVRAQPIDPLCMTPEQSRRLDGHACARCGGTEDLRPNGMAYTRSGSDGTGRLAWPVKTCRYHAHTGGIQ